MADKKISALTALTAANVAPATDVVPIVDTSATETKKVTAKDLVDGALNGGTANGVLYLNGSKAATSGSALVFDGTNLGIGTSSPGARLHSKSSLAENTRIEGTTARGGGNVYASFYDPAGRKGYFGYSGVDDSFNMVNEMNAHMSFGTNGSERMRLDSSGRLLVGTSSANISSSRYACFNAPSGANVTGSFKNDGGSAAQVVEAWNSATTGNNVFVTFYTETSATERGGISYNRSSGLVAYGTTSDYRAKEIIGPVQNPGATIDALRVYEGVMKGATQSRPMLIAHETQAHAPYAVSGVKDDLNEDGTPKFQQMDVSSLVPLLLAELQSLRARVAALEAK